MCYVVLQSEVFTLLVRIATILLSTSTCRLCPKIAEYEAEFKNSKVWTDHWNQTKALLAAISNAINFTVG